MNNTLRAVLPFFAISLILAAALAILALLVQRGRTTFIVPPPEQEAEAVLRDLAAHDDEQALDHLSAGLRSSLDAQALRQAYEALEQATGGIYDVSGESSQVQGAAAQAEVKLTFDNQVEQTIHFPLQSEQGLWRVTSLEPLLALAGQGGD
jgi:hypothetical protein